MMAEYEWPEREAITFDTLRMVASHMLTSPSDRLIILVPPRKVAEVMRLPGVVSCDEFGDWARQHEIPSYVFAASEVFLFRKNNRGDSSIEEQARRELAEEEFRNAVEQRKAVLRTEAQAVPFKRRVIDALINYLEKMK